MCLTVYLRGCSEFTLCALHVGHAATAKGLEWMARPAAISRTTAGPQGQKL
jgi:hypothetical protein